MGLVVAWQLWPRARGSRLRAGKSEHVFGAFVKIGTDGRVTVAVPQVEMGQGVYTTLPQLVADELGADWRMIGVEAAPLGPEYSNPLLSALWNEGLWTQTPLTLTGGSTSMRAFERPMREAGAAARTLLCMAAAQRWGVDWQACETRDGSVVLGRKRLRFGELAEDAAALDLPGGTLSFRRGSLDRLAGQSVPRLDLPAKIDGSANFAADVRLPDMVFAAIAMGPSGGATVKDFDRDAAQNVPGALGVEATEHWVAGIGTNSWAAARALEAARVRFAVAGAPAGARAIDRAIDAAFAEGFRIAETGDVGAAFRGAKVLTAEYRLGLRPHAALEPMAATAAFEDGRLRLWVGTQAPSLAVEAAARATGLSVDDVTVFPMLIGGSCGARFETDVAVQAAILAQRLKRPVQVQWSRAEDLRQDRFGAAAAVRLSALLAPGGRIEGWLAKVAMPASFEEMRARVRDGDRPDVAMRATAGTRSRNAVEGAVPPYAIAGFAVDHHPADLGIPTGEWRGGANVATIFATECFIDELAAQAGVDPFAFRIGLLDRNPRLAQCLLRVTALGDWQGAASGQGLAVHSMADSHIAVLAQAARGPDGRIKVSRLAAVVDCGRVINPGIVRQQIAGGLIFGLSAVTGARVDIESGGATPNRLGALALPRLADAPWITIELVRSSASPGGVSELAVPPTAPAIVNALASMGGIRPRTLPVPLA